MRLLHQRAGTRVSFINQWRAAGSRVGLRWRRGSQLDCPQPNAADQRASGINHSPIRGKPSEQIGDMKLHYVKSIEEVVDLALEPKLPTQ
jgi:hypothetical protein